MSESGLYPRGPSDAERKAMLKRLDAERKARWEAEAKAKAERDRVEREARFAVEEAEREAKRLAAVEAETAAISALVGDPRAMAKLVRRLVAEVADLKAANRSPSHKASVGASIDDGQLSNGTMHGQRERLVEDPPWKKQANWNG
jgi:membrane protein involved in colicin uptake